MLAKKFRLFRRDFLIAKSKGKTFRSPHFSLVNHPNSLGHFRASVVTSAKLDKKAVIRNRLRRQIYSVLSPSHLVLSTDVIIFPNKSMLNLSREEISLELNQALSKIAPHGGA